MSHAEGTGHYLSSNVELRNGFFFFFSMIRFAVEKDPLDGSVKENAEGGRSRCR